jgi:hypothetical protein
MLGALLRLDRNLRRHRRQLGSSNGLWRLVFALGALVGLGLAGNALLNPAEVETLPVRVGHWVFWCMTAAALVLGYASFEVLYRDPVSRRLDILPIDASAHFWWKVYRAYRLHLGLVLIPAASGATLLFAGEWVRWLQGVGATLGVVVWGLALAIYAHLWAGQSLLDGGTKMKAYLASGFGPPETAFLFYSPALALLGAMTVGVFTELSLGTGVAKGIWNPLFVVGGIATAAGLLSLVRAKAIFVADHHRITPRFNDAEIPPPWVEGELPRQVMGLGLAQYVPEAARAVYKRDILQYRRRFRIMVPLTVCAAAALLGYAANTSGEPGAALRVIVAAATVGVLAFIPVFRSAGPELARRFDSRAMPIGVGQQRLTQWLLAALEWIPLAVASAAGLALGGDFVAAIIALFGILFAFGVTNAVAIPLALKASPDVAFTSWAVRAALILALGLTSTLAQGVTAMGA